MKDKKFNIITVDGDSASGKSSVSDNLAERLGYIHIDGGVVFRTVGYLREAHEIDLSSFCEVLSNGSILNEVSFCGQRAFYKGVEITKAIQSELAGRNAADLGKYEYFQQWFINYLKAVVKSGKSNFIVSGRIGGSIIFPDADHKIYLTAKTNTKSTRRYLQLGDNLFSRFEFDDVKNSIAERDNIRSLMPYFKLKLSAETVRIDTTNFSINEVTNIILKGESRLCCLKKSTVVPGRLAEGV